MSIHFARTHGTPLRAIGALLAASLLFAAPFGAAQAESHRELLAAGATGRVFLADPENLEDVLREISLEVGKSVFIQTDYRVRRVSVGNDEIVDVGVLGTKELQLVAKEIGTTNVVLWSPGGSPKASIDVVVGAAHSHIEGELQRVLGSSDIHVDGAGESVVLRGSVTNELDVERAQAVAAAFYPADEARVVNLLGVGGNHQVMLEVVIAELSRTVTRSMGVDFAANGVTNSGNTVQILNSLAGLSTVDSILTSAQAFALSDSVNLFGSYMSLGGDFYAAFVDIIEEKGIGKILAEPTLVARSGETASFLAGGEVPILIPQGTVNNTITVEYKDFGVALLFTPTVLNEGRIHIDVVTEVSEPDDRFGIDLGDIRVPSFNTRRAQTSVELGDGHSFAIAGLLSDQVDELSSHYPWIGEVPIIGPLFRSAEFKKKQTELVMIVTPRLAQPLDPNAERPLPTDHFVEPNAFDFYFMAALEGIYTTKWFADDDEPQAGTAQADGAGGVDQARALRASALDAEPRTTGGLIGGAGLRIESAPEPLAPQASNSHKSASSDAAATEVIPWDE